MLKIGLTINQLGLLLRVVRIGKEKARRQIHFKKGDFDEFLIIEDKIIDAKRSRR